MLRFSLALLLICASAQAMAQNGRNPPNNPGACQDSEVARDAADPAVADHAASKATRSKYARASANGTSARSTGGGSDDALPRSRGARWHSFLPGMFR